MTTPDNDATSGAQSTDGRSRTERASRRGFLKAAGLGAAGTVLGSGVFGQAAAAGIPTPLLTRDGNLLRDPNGEKVILRGVNTVDPKRAAAKAPYYKLPVPTQMEMATDESNGWYARVMRVPLQPTDIGGHSPGAAAPVVAFDQDQLDEYLETYVDPLVQKAAEIGMYVILDYHRHFPDGPRWDDPALDEEITMFWETVAPRYGGNPHVLFEVYNEPTEPYAGHDIYDGGPDVTDPESEQTWLDWRETAQPWVDLIREGAPEAPIVIGSPRWSQWTYWAPEHEFDGHNLAYAGHAYTQDGLRPLSTYFGEPSEEVPVFLSEFGWGGSEPQLQGDAETYAPQFANLFDEYDMHWQAWCFDFNWEPSMLDRDYQVKNEWGQFVKDRLAAKRDQDLPTVEPSNTPESDTDTPTPEPDTDTPTPDPDDLPAVGDNDAAPADPDGDGLYEDVNGNGDGDLADAVDLFQNRDADEVTGNVDAYDFSGNEEVDLADVVELYQENTN